MQKSNNLAFSPQLLDNKYLYNANRNYLFTVKPSIADEVMDMCEIYREIDGDNHNAPCFSLAGFVLLSAQSDSASGFPTIFLQVRQMSIGPWIGIWILHDSALH